MARAKTKVLSVRLSLESLQSCFDLCDLLGHTTSGASSAISRTVESLTANMRQKNIIPSYTASELEVLIPQFMAKINPTSSCEQLDKISFTNSDFAPSQLPVTEGEVDEISNEIEAFTPDDEYNDLIEEQIRERMREDESDLLSKILI